MWGSSLSRGFNPLLITPPAWSMGITY
jgi:hypothetical protein